MEHLLQDSSKFQKVETDLLKAVMKYEDKNRKLSNLLSKTTLSMTQGKATSYTSLYVPRLSVKPSPLKEKSYHSSVYFCPEMPLMLRYQPFGPITTLFACRFGETQRLFTCKQSRE